jgi:hypothetical protein
VGAAATTALVVRSRTSPQRWLWLIAGALTWGAVLWSGGRGPLLALAAGFGGWFCLRANDRKPLAVAVTLQLLAGLAVSAAFWTPRPELGWWHAFARTAAAASQPGAVNMSALSSTRTDFWRESAQRAARSPWIGHGPDAYRFLTPKLDGQQPHNVVLQLWLDLGLLGALPALALLGGIVMRGSWRARVTDTGDPLAPWVALLTTLIVAGLLDGIFYHVLTLLPVMLAFGVVLLSSCRAASTASAQLGAADMAQVVRPHRVSAFLVSIGVGSAIGVSTLHTFLFHAVVVASPPTGPQATAARMLRTFPSTTFGLWGWLDQWHRTNPDAALGWARWAQRHATNPSIFHIRAAQYLSLRGDHAGAIAEMNLAEEKAHYLTRPSIAEMKKTLLSAP